MATSVIQTRCDAGTESAELCRVTMGFLTRGDMACLKLENTCFVRKNMIKYKIIFQPTDLAS